MASEKTGGKVTARWQRFARPMRSIPMDSAARSLGFVVLYVALDWVSYVAPLLELNVTPWNPVPALGLLYLMRRGRWGLGPLFLGVVASEILVRHVPGGLAVTFWLGLVLTLGYFAIAMALRRNFPSGELFSDLRSLLPWTVVVVVGALANGLLFTSQLLLTGLLPGADWFDAVMRVWIGDGVGIFVTMPLLWWLQDASHRALFGAAIRRGETVGYAVLTVLVLWVAFVPGADTSFRYLYVLFLPLVWAASRQGFAGAAFCVSMLQLGMLVAGLLRDLPDLSLFELQVHAFLLALVGFLIGMTVDEQRRSAAELRQSLRLAAAGEMAGALAHELNQPLTALAAYGSACEKLLERGADDGQFREVMRKMINEADRAANVVRRLRDFFRTGATHLERIPLSELLETVSAPFHGKATTAAVEFVVEAVPEAVIHGDRLQLEVVLRNLLANAFEAVAEARVSPKRVRLGAMLEEGGRVVIDVADSGPGLSASIAGQLFEPFRSTKSSGLGLGLAISRAITEAHGGTLTAWAGEGGFFRLTLPIEASGRKVPSVGERAERQPDDSAD